MDVRLYCSNNSIRKAKTSTIHLLALNLYFSAKFVILNEEFRLSAHLDKFSHESYGIYTAGSRTSCKRTNNNEERLGGEGKRKQNANRCEAICLQIKSAFTYSLDLGDVKVAANAHQKN